MENVTGRIQMAVKEVLIDLEISSFSELLGFDLDSRGDLQLFITSAVRNIASCDSNGKSLRVAQCFIHNRIQHVNAGPLKINVATLTHHQLHEQS